MQNVMRQGALLALFLLITSATGWAQTGVMQGTVVDPQGNALPGVKVSAFDEAKGLVARETTTEKDGSFRLLPLLRGQYTLRVEAQGFKQLAKPGLVLDPNQIMELGQLALEVGDIVNTVTVQAEPPLVETGTAQKSFVISSTQVTELALNGRDFGSLVKTLPGVTSDQQSDFNFGFNSTATFNVNGGRNSTNNVFLDGTVNTDVGDNRSQYTSPSIDAVGEFKVQTSVFNAEFGRITGVLISASTKSGGKSYRGTLFGFHRNDAFDARNPFLTLPNNQQPVKDKLRYNQFGGNIGGPVWLPKKIFGPLGTETNPGKLFFFFNYEGTRGNRPTGPQFYDVPHPDLLTGDFRRLLRTGNIANSTCQYPGEAAPRPCQIGTVFRPGTIQRNAAGNVIGGVPYANNTIPQAEWSRNAAAFIRIFNLFDRTGAIDVPGSPELIRVTRRDRETIAKDQMIARIDYQISPRHTFFFRWVDETQREERGRGIFTNPSFAVLPQFREKPGSSWSWNLINVLTPTMTNEVIFGYTHQSQVVDITPDRDPALYDRDALGFTYGQLFPQSNLRNRFPNFNCRVGSCNINTYPTGWLNDGKDYSITDNFTYTRGAHTFKFGGLFNVDDKQQQPAWTDAGFFDFNTGRDNPGDTNNGLANLLLGNYIEFSQTDGRYYGSFRYWGAEAYAQDTWRATRRLNLEFGARYVYLQPTYTRGALLQNYFDPDRYNPARAVTIETAAGLRRGSIIPGSGDPFNGMVEEGDGIPLGFSKHRWNQVSPRLGFALDLFGDGKTALRGGFGTFWERIRQNVINFGGIGNPPLSYTPRVFAGRVDDLSPAVISGGVRFPVNVTAVDKQGKLPTTYTWSLGLQRELPGAIALDVSYVGNVARHLQYVRDLNQLPVGTAIAASLPNAIRPYKGYGSVNLTEFAGNSNYHSLQLRASRRFSKRLTANVSYTWSRALTDVGIDDNSAALYSYDRRRDYGLAGFHRSHVINIDYNYELPRGSKLIGDNWLTRAVFDGWQVSGITRFWTGLPLTITSNGDAGTLGGGPRANYLGGPVYPEEQSVEMFFNPFAFGRPLQGDLGNTSRSFLYGPGVHNWDISVFKNTKIGERVRTQLRVEMFNAFNHTQWFGVNTGLSAPNPGAGVTETTRGNFGRVTSTRDPRNIQLALKLYF